MRITVIPSDGTIGIDSESIANIPEQYLEWIPENVHAFHWYDDQNYGEIEYYFPFAEQKNVNKIVNELGVWKNAITTFNDEIKRREDAKRAELEAIEAATDYWEILNNIVIARLVETDWTQGLDSPLSFDEKESWKEYRKKLRNLTNVTTNPKELVNDKDNPLWPVYELKEYPDHGLFWDSFAFTDIYAKVREQALTSLPITVISAELISLFGDAKIGNVKVELIQDALTKLLQNLILEEQDYVEIQNLLIVSKLDTLYSIA
jgi:uncharacterized protein YqgQ